MPTGFHQQLDALTTTIAELCAHAGRAVQGATQALLHADVALAESVISEYERSCAPQPTPNGTPSSCWLCMPPWPAIYAPLSPP